MSHRDTMVQQARNAAVALWHDLLTLVRVEARTANPPEGSTWLWWAGCGRRGRRHVGPD